MNQENEDLISAYVAVFGATFSIFSVKGSSVLMQKALPLMRASLEPDGKPITNADLGIEIPEGALS
jgi:hypothetical protein